MKQFIRILFITLLVIPILTISKIQATPGGPRAGQSSLDRMPMGRFEQRESFRNPFDNPFRQIDSHGRGRGMDDHGDDHDGQGNDGNRAPLDGGLSLLLAAGIGLGVKKAAQRKNAAAADAGEIGEAK